MSNRFERPQSFEEACRNAPFSELIRLAIGLASAARMLIDWAHERRSSVQQRSGEPGLGLGNRPPEPQ